MSKVYVTGVAGFLGSHLADALIARGFDVYGNDSLLGGELSNVPLRVNFARVDCNEFDSLAAHMGGSEVVFHCAATAYEGLSVFSPHLVTQNIVGASTSVFSAAISTHARRIVHCSSMARYGVGTPPFREDDTLRPEDPYGIGKVCAEEMLRNLGEVHGIEYAIAVPHNIIGPRQRYYDPFRNVASIMINRVLQGKQPVIYGDGTQRRCFSYVADCIQCLLKMGFQEDVNKMTINIGPDEGTISIFALACKVWQACGKGGWPNPIYMPGRPREVKFAFCSSDRARKYLGYRTEWTLDRGLAEMVGHIRQAGVRPFDYHLPIEIVSDKTPRTWTDRII